MLGSRLILKSITSVTSAIPLVELVNQIDDALVKSSIIMMSRFLAKEFLQTKVRINTISPGGVFDYQNKTFLKRYSRYCSNKKLLDPSDLDGLVEFLVSDASKKITGQDFVIDDGYTL